MRTELSEAESAPQNDRVRYAAGKSFAQKGEVQTADGVGYPLWVDTALTAEMTPRPVSFGSDEYFALTSDARVAQWLALSPALVVVIGGEAVQIVLDSGSEPAATATPVAPVEPVETTAPSFWQRLWDALLGRD